MRQLIVVAVVVACVAISIQAEEPRMEVRVGALIRTGMKMKASGGTYAGEGDRASAVQSALSPNRSGTVLSGRSSAQASIADPASDALGIGDRSFDNGYNRVSPPTQATPDHDTWFWGYDSKAAQYDAGAQQMVYTRTSSGSDAGSYEQYRVDEYSLTSVAGRSGDLSGEETFGQFGLFGEAAFPLAARERVTLALVGGASLSWCDDRDVSYEVSTSVRESRVRERSDLEPGYDWTLTRTFTETYRYDDLGNVVPGIPGDTHAGDYAGPGPVIPNTPASRTVSSSDALAVTPHGSRTGRGVVSSGDWQGVSRVDISADMLRGTLYAGPELGYACSERISLSIAPKLTLNLVDMSATRKERLEVVAPSGERTTARTWRDEKDAQKWVAGASLSAALSCSLNPLWALRLADGGEWAFEKPKMNIGPSELTFDLDSLNMEVSAARQF